MVDRYLWRYDDAHEKGAAEIVIRRTPDLAPLWSQFEPDPSPRTKQRHPPQHSKKSASQLTAPDLLALIDSNNAAYYIRPVVFWRDTATDEQLEELAGVLARETSVHRLRHILQVFVKRPLPQFEAHADAFLKLALHSDWHVKHRANVAMSQLNHQRIRGLALSHLLAQEWLVGELTPLKSNLRPGDSRLLAKYLKVDRNDYRQHCLISDLVEICQANPWPEMLEVMLFIYQTSPCTFCRGQIYRLMLQENLLPDWIAEEWPYDASSRWDD